MKSDFSTRLPVTEGTSGQERQSGDNGSELEANATAHQHTGHLKLLKARMCRKGEEGACDDSIRPGIGDALARAKNLESLAQIMRVREGNHDAPKGIPLKRQWSADMVRCAMHGRSDAQAIAVLSRLVFPGVVVPQKETSAAKKSVIKRFNAHNTQLIQDLLAIGDSRERDLILAHVMPHNKSLYDRSVGMIDDSKRHERKNGLKGDMSPSVLLHALTSVVKGLHYAKDPQAQYGLALKRAGSIPDEKTRLKADTSLMITRPSRRLEKCLLVNDAFGLKSEEEKLVLVKHIVANDPQLPGGWANALRIASNLPPGVQPTGGQSLRARMAPFLKTVVTIPPASREQAFYSLSLYWGGVPSCDRRDVVEDFCKHFDELPEIQIGSAYRELVRACESLDQADKISVLPSMLSVIQNMKGYDTAHALEAVTGLVFSAWPMKDGRSPEALKEHLTQLVGAIPALPPGRRHVLLKNLLTPLLDGEVDMSTVRGLLPDLDKALVCIDDAMVAKDELRSGLIHLKNKFEPGAC